MFSLSGYLKGSLNPKPTQASFIDSLSYQKCRSRPLVLPLGDAGVRVSPPPQTLALGTKLKEGRTSEHISHQDKQ